MEIAALKASLLTKDEQIVTLQRAITEYQIIIDVLESKIWDKDKIIDEKTRQIRRLKIKNAIGGIGGSLAIVGLLIAIILIN
jgi:Ethanolamine utilization protein EutJ (predicted chaperonin)